MISQKLKEKISFFWITWTTLIRSKTLKKNATLTPITKTILSRCWCKTWLQMDIVPFQIWPLETLHLRMWTTTSISRWIITHSPKVLKVNLGKQLNCKIWGWQKPKIRVRLEATTSLLCIKIPTWAQCTILVRLKKNMTLRNRRKIITRMRIYSRSSFRTLMSILCHLLFMKATIFPILLVHLSSTDYRWRTRPSYSTSRVSQTTEEFDLLNRINFSWMSNRKLRCSSTCSCSINSRGSMQTTTLVRWQVLENKNKENLDQKQTTRLRNEAAWLHLGLKWIRLFFTGRRGLKIRIWIKSSLN